MRLRELIKKILWAKYQRLIWQTDRSKSNLDQIIWRLEMNHGSIDQRIALSVARKLYRDNYGVKAPSDTERKLHELPEQTTWDQYFNRRRQP